MAAEKFKHVAILYEKHTSPVSSTDQINSQKVMLRVISAFTVFSVVAAVLPSSSS